MPNLNLSLSFNLDPVKTSFIYVPDDPEYMRGRQTKAMSKQFNLTPKQQAMKQQFLGLICAIKKKNIHVNGERVIEACRDYFTERELMVDEFQLGRGDEGILRHSAHSHCFRK